LDGPPSGCPSLDSEDHLQADFVGGNAVWTSLPFVQAGKVHRLEDGIWMFGGLASLTQYVDAVVAAMTK